MENLLGDKYWEEGGYLLDRSIGSTWWEFMEGSRFFLWGWPRDFQKDIRDGKNKCQVGPWTKFLQPQKSVRYEEVGLKDFRKISNVQRRGCVRTG